MRPAEPELLQPVLSTTRLLLRAFDLGDAPVVQQLAGAIEVADTTLNIPHPYREGMAEAWILSHKQLFRTATLVNFAITLNHSSELIGAIGLRLRLEHGRAELGYWLGVPYWGRGYCTEAGQAMLGYGFDVLGLNRIHAAHFERNPASGRVLLKLGMVHEGRQRQHVRKSTRYEDLETYAILRTEYERRKSEGR